MNTAWSIDWLSGTFKGQVRDIDIRKHTSFGYKLRAWAEMQARFGYSSAMIHPFGHYVMTNQGRPEMGVHLAYTGRALRAIAEQGIEASSLVQWFVESGANITRLDLAIDVFDVEIDPMALAQCARVKTEPGTARKWSFVKGHDNGCTAYVGSRKSEKFLRIYDKAAEQGRNDILWTRFELELKGDSARAASRAMSDMTPDERPIYIKGLMRALFNPDDTMYQEIMNCPAAVLKTTKDTDDNTLDWLMNSVAKTIAKTMMRRADVDVYALLIEAVHANITAMGGFLPD